MSSPGEQINWGLTYIQETYGSYSPEALSQVNDAALQDCPDCYGTGIEPRTVDFPCEFCYGEGYI
jgi:DnaJ-class molecular chaperone